MTLEEDSTNEENNSFVYKNIEEVTLRCNNPIKKNDIIEQFLKLQISDESQNNNNNSYLINKKEENRKHIKTSSESKNVVEREVYIKEERRLPTHLNNKKSDGKNEVTERDSDEETESSSLEILERGPVRNTSSSRVSVYDISKRNSKRHEVTYTGLSQNKIIANTNSNILTNCEDEFFSNLFSTINTDDLISLTDEIDSFNLLEQNNIKNNEINHKEVKEIKIKEICEYLKSENFTETPQLTRIISELGSHGFSKNEFTKDSEVSPVGNVTVQSQFSMPSSPQQASTPPQMAVIPDISQNATMPINYELAKTVESQHLTIVTPVSTPLSIGLCTMILNDDKKPNITSKQRKILPKVQSYSEDSQQSSIITNTKKKQSRMPSDNRTVQEYLGSKIPSSEKKDFMKNFMNNIKDIEEIVKPIDSDGKTILHIFVLNQDINKTYLLVEQIKSNIKSHKSCGRRLKDYINIRDNNGYTPLFYAVRNNYKILTAYLRECGGDSYLADYIQKNTPFHIATLHGNKALTVMGLLCHPTNDNVDITNAHGQTVLHAALHEKQIDNPERNELIKFLLKKKHKVSSQDKLGKTVLHYAVKYCAKTDKFDILEILLTEGCDSSIAKLIQDNRGKTILHEAALQNHMPIERQKELINFLIVHCSELLEVKTKDGKLPYQLVTPDRLLVKNELQCKWDNNCGYVKI
ncbi:uncharacterized protein LOC111637419 [Centruroides sculpturatus]|uniref:uncharacterized protein LOC111637419 n=1 Tax=Centruroides sculpturatus TaxID=218467 RepID=UPI000C6DAA2D|nr:uncharacterized protein LOC111637419 [Centruroides sculpturatus]XP_023238673.1 uncharacterized protein LOC111637419 [Centruroides sculpturatus]XP_023238674.1 uncharacterized protein LOC111637419 [Centruroides sculpturatus]